MKRKMTLDKLAEMMNQRFDGVGQEFVKVYDRFSRVDQRIDGLETTMNHRFDEVGSRLTSLEKRTVTLESL